jgi:hypothetical protein
LVSIEEVKKHAVEIIESQIHLTLLLTQLNNKEIEEFNQWYKTNWHYMKLQEFLQLMAQKRHTR